MFSLVLAELVLISHINLDVLTFCTFTTIDLNFEKESNIFAHGFTYM